MDSSQDEATLTREMLGLELYVITSSPARSPETLAVLPEHLDHQVRLENEGILFLAGPLTLDGSDTPLAGMIVIRAHSFDEARAIADRDPFHAKGIRSYTLHRWRVNEGNIRANIRLSDQSVGFA